VEIIRLFFSFSRPLGKGYLVSFCEGKVFLGGAEYTSGSRLSYPELGLENFFLGSSLIRLLPPNLSLPFGRIWYNFAGFEG
jgi:hypothetical protein